MTDTPQLPKRAPRHNEDFMVIHEEIKAFSKFMLQFRIILNAGTPGINQDLMLKIRTFVDDALGDELARLKKHVPNVVDAVEEETRALEKVGVEVPDVHIEELFE